VIFTSLSFLEELRKLIVSLAAFLNSLFYFFFSIFVGAKVEVVGSL
jgi:hypothetical protein